MPYTIHFKNEVKKIKEDIAGKNVAIIFDGTTHVCEAFAIVIHYIDRN